jgi:RecA/RadA recombinase
MAKKKKAEAEPEAPSKQEDLAVLMQHINTMLNAETPKSEWKKYLITADEVVSPFILRRRTGIIGLDLALGGGFPAGGAVQIAAEEGVGKNALCLQTIAECQRIYGDDAAIAWGCTELSFDKPFAHLMGVSVPMSDGEIALEEQARLEQGLPPMDALEIAERKRSVGSFVIVDYGSVEKRLDAIVELIRSNVFQIVVVDSMAAILTQQQDDTALDEYAQQSSEAMLLTRWQNKLTHAFGPDAEGNPNWTTLIKTNQVREKRNRKGPFDRAWRVGGARACKHANLGDIWLVRGEQLMATVGDDDVSLGVPLRKRKVVLGKRVKWEIHKGKAGFHEGPKGTVDYHFDEGFQIEKDLVDTALERGVIVRLKPSVYGVISPDGEVVEEVRGRQQLYLKAFDGEWFHRVYTFTLRKAGITCLYKL